ncbi:sensor histidine kinase [Spirochaeta africana]|uniref:histidine kinase n=1 Tax=Spirochaeta africana (strain ATCC 700263 / DSM 8902 / Z-7692) TaxID=889378 RepID=H9UME9_SPIAZ|nr:ATP-binding protein [Spirochaeta africana]AFG38692.1 histidine kinase,HAMP domain-containing protein,histidine kinase [Spirochaeta africana DSM 8902]
MRARRTTGASMTGIASLILMYVAATAMVVALARRILIDVTFLGSAPSALLVIIVVLFPIGLLILVIVNMVRLVQDRIQQRPGSGLRLRFLAANVFIVLLAAIPQGIMSITFMAGAMDTWFNPESVQAIRGGLAISIGYYSERVDDLESFADSPVVQGLLSSALSEPERAWENLQSLSPRLDAIQVWGPQGEELFHAGVPEVRIGEEQLRLARAGFVAKESAGEVSFLRIIVPTGPFSDHRAMLALRLPSGFDQNAERLTRTLETFSQVERFQPLFLLGVMIFYLAFAVPLILLSLLVSFTLSDEIMRPIESLEEATRRVAAGDYSYRILSRSGGDISHLVDSFNSMIQELDTTRRKIRQTEKVAAWQEIAQRLAHEIKNPLTPIQLSAERLLQKYRRGDENFSETLERSVGSIIREVNGLAAMLTEFRNFSTLPKPTVRTFALLGLLEEASDLYRHEAGVQFDFSEVPVDFELQADPDMLRRVFANLWRNAVEAMNGEGRILVRADVVKKGRSSYARIQVQDTGPGIRPEEQEKVFHPYFTTKPHGTGLGLAIVERILFDHNGSIWFETQPGDGTTFFMDFPLE